MSDEPTTFGIVQWAGALALTAITAAIGGLHRRINREGDMLRGEIREAEKRSSDSRQELKHELQEGIAVVRNEGREGLSALRNDILPELRTIRASMERMVTKDDLRDLLAILRPSRKEP